MIIISYLIAFLCILIPIIAFSSQNQCKSYKISKKIDTFSNLMSFPLLRSNQGKKSSGMHLSVLPDLSYTYVPPEVGPEIYAGSTIAMIPIFWATYEFTSRLVIQRRCLVCQGSGLTLVSRQGSLLSRPRKCWSCGGFMPWFGWKAFLDTSRDDIGNGGPLQRPAKDFREINEKIKSGEWKLPSVSLEDYYDNSNQNDDKNDRSSNGSNGNSSK